MTRLGGALVVLLLLSVVPAPTYAQAVAAAPAPQLTVEQMKTFLKSAKVVRSRTPSKGVNGRGRGETTELNFVDSYRYNLAAYAVAGLLGLDHMMPVYVERRWSGQIGSISWFVPSIMDESERLKNKVQPPNPTDWNHQMYRMRVFTALTRDTDRNLTNVLITPDWKVVMIDFSRAFRLQPELMYGKDLGRIDRKLMAKLEALDGDEVKKTVGDWLTSGEMDAMMKRRDLLVAHFKKLIADVGEDKVLY
jgi:hypothetical protein